MASASGGWSRNWSGGHHCRRADRSFHRDRVYRHWPANHRHRSYTGPTVTVPGPTVMANPSGGVAPFLPDGVTVRRSTGTSPIHLRNGYSVDLDDNTSPNWSVNANSRGDVGWAGVDTLYFDSDYAREKGAVGYSTCAKETGYQNNQPAVMARISHTAS